MDHKDSFPHCPSPACPLLRNRKEEGQEWGIPSLTSVEFLQRDNPFWDFVTVVDREGDSTLLQYSCLENPMDGGAWWAAVHGVAKSQTQLRDFTFTFHSNALVKEMATHSSVLAWRIPGTGEPGGLPSMEPHRVGHDWSDLAAAAATVVEVTL